MDLLVRLLRAVPLLILSPFLLLIAALSLALADCIQMLRGKKTPAADTRPSTRAASVVIPNWNGSDLLEKYIPSIIRAMAASNENEIIVVDNGSSDGSAEFLRNRYPAVRVVALPENLGFGGGSNAGFAEAKNDIVVLLNSDMRTDENFLAPLLEGFSDERVFAVSCQIFFRDEKKPREETGLTQAWWANGGLRVRHRIDNRIRGAYPCFYGGGGSCAFDRRKFAELGGFDRLLSPFYLEDTDLGFLAWKRGWKVLYEPRSIVYHEHRGTIGKTFSEEYIQSILKKNFILFCWKNIHEWPRLCSHFVNTWASAVFSVFAGDSPERSNLNGIWRAFLQLPHAVASRIRARELAVIGDTEAFRRPLGGYFRDRFETLPSQPEKLRVLFLSPYPICPPVHGGGVFMYQTIRELRNLTELHLIALLDHDFEVPLHKELDEICASTEYLIRMQGHQKVLGSIVPHAVREFSNDDLRWAIHRTILLQKIDVLQLDYTNMGQYAAHFRQIPSILFEHDIYFQSVGRMLPKMSGGFRKISAAYEYLRAIRFELRMLPHLDRVQVCSRENRDYLLGFLPQLSGKIEDGLRAGIDTSRYEFRTEGRQPGTLLFLGSFRHIPNQEALNWFVHHVYPLVIAQRPSARLIIIGADPPPAHSLPALPNIELIGYVDDVRAPFRDYAVFLCPILSGSGVRVKLLEAFSAGIPCVSTTLGAEGLAREDGDICALADTPEAFTAKIIYLLDHPDEARAMAIRARQEVVENWDMTKLTLRLDQSYRRAVEEMRNNTRR